jgi:hypothetical protein
MELKKGAPSVNPWLLSVQNETICINHGVNPEGN